MKHLGEAIATAAVATVFIGGFWILCILFGGDPDLMDAIIEYIQSKSH